jgi:membrane-associated phospholipid phosphatase
MQTRRILVSALVAGALAESARRARSGEVRPPEERVFRVANGAPNGLHPPLWAVMQSGSLAAVFVVAGALTCRRRSGPATAALVAGTAVWGGVKAVKPRIGRGRPAHHLDGVAVRGQPQTGLGYPSGHAAVSLTLALIATKDERPAVRGAAVAAAATTGVARMYVGAHLPLDIVGGFAIGVIAGQAANAVRR